MVGQINLSESQAPFLYLATYKHPVTMSGDSKKMGLQRGGWVYCLGVFNSL